MPLDYAGKLDHNFSSPTLANGLKKAVIYRQAEDFPHHVVAAFFNIRRDKSAQFEAKKASSARLCRKARPKLLFANPRQRSAKNRCLAQAEDFPHHVVAAFFNIRRDKPAQFAAKKASTARLHGQA
ncbi:MAG: hypothetical protein ACI4JT_06570 [Oscillospiraceae bacterium]